MADQLKDIVSKEEYARMWHDVQFGRMSSVCWIEVKENDKCPKWKKAFIYLHKLLFERSVKRSKEHGQKRRD